MKAARKKALDSYDIIKKEITNTIINYNLNDIYLKNNNKNKIIKKSSIIFQNLKKYSTTKKSYDIFIINSIIFDQKMHIVSIFKNYLLWDETSEFLKRFYNEAESLERIPNISQYYESYTLFAPVYFGLSATITLIMNEWTKNKKAYLEYIEDKEDEENEKKKYNLQDLNYKKLIDTELLLNSEPSNTKSKTSKKTIDLTMYDKIDSFFLKDINLSSLEKDRQVTDDKIKNKNSSLSKIMEDLSSHYSIYIANSYKPKVAEVNKCSKNNNNRSKKIESRKETKKNNKNIVLSDKMLFSFTNLYKKRNKKKKKFHAGTCNNSSSKVKRSQIYEKNNQEKKSKDKIITKSKININKNLSNILKKKFNMQITNLKSRINNFTRNKSILKEKKENNKRYTLTNVNNSCINSSNNSYFKFKIKKNKFKKLVLRNIKINTSSYTHYRNSNNNNNSSNMNNTSQNKNEKSNDKVYKCNLTKLLTSKDGKNKNFLLNGNIINLKNMNSYGYIKQNNKKVNNAPFYYKNNKLIKEKKAITSRNSFSNNQHNLNKSNNSKYKKSLSKSKNNTKKLFNKKLSGNLKNTVLTQFHLKNDKAKKNLISSFSKNLVSRNNSLLKNKKKTFSGRSSKKLNDSLSVKPYKKELNKINFNFNFNINFNIDINKNRQKKYLLAYKNKNNLGCLTQRNQIINNSKLNRSKNKSRGDNSHRKNNVNHIFMNKK